MEEGRGSQKDPTFEDANVADGPRIASETGLAEGDSGQPDDKRSEISGIFSAVRSQ